MEHTRQVCSDSEVFDCWSPSVGARAPTIETTVCCARLDCFDCDVPVRVLNLLETGRDAEECLSVLRHVDEVLPDVSVRVCCCADVLVHRCPRLGGGRS